ncbi:MAG TPA: dTMP kinase [Acidimicrobiia bacterium]|nr:dTMP kinase [Acidimicrobiia bacterium]
MTAFYLAIEGGDGAGKTTVAARLQRLLEDQGATVRLVREPGGTSLGEEIRRLLLHSSDMTPWAEAMLFGAQRAQLVAEVVGPALQRGEVVISDRSFYSSLAYQGGARGLGIEDVRSINLAAVAGVVPDLVVVLTIDPRQALARQSDPDRIGREGSRFQDQVAAAYELLAELEPDRVVLVEAGHDPEEVAAKILTMIEGKSRG